MSQPMHYLKETASQTAGPYVHIGLAPGDAGFDIYRQEIGRNIVGANPKGTAITVTGLVTDGNGDPVKDVLIEVWQADADGLYPSKGGTQEGFRGWGRVVPDFESGEFSFNTIKPGPVLDDMVLTMAPHLNLWLVARGINVGLNTRLYFDDEPEANAADPVLNLIESSQRRDTLVARKQDTGYRFDISLQGDAETVFFDV
ncbi:MAG: protocatechuate 3,4-dioxygenase subunit alpha [Pseudomonadota bacterium]